MQNTLRTLVFFCAVLLIAACKKDTPTQPVQPEPQVLPVRSVKGTFIIPSSPYVFSEHHSYDYNAGGQLITNVSKTFTGENGSPLYQYTAHEYTKGRLTKTTSSVSGAVDFVYNDNGQIIKQNRNMGGLISDLITYNPNGSIAKLVIASEPARDDPWTCVYNYSADGLLANIVITPKMDPKSAGTIYFSDYTEECDFDPLVMNQLMDVFSFFPPLAMQGWKRLPKQVNYVFTDGSGENNHIYTYTIKDRYIEKMTRERTRPDPSTIVKYSFNFFY